MASFEDEAATFTFLKARELQELDREVEEEGLDHTERSTVGGGLRDPSEDLYSGKDFYLASESYKAKLHRQHLPHPGAGVAPHSNEEASAEPFGEVSALRAPLSAAGGATTTSPTAELQLHYALPPPPFFFSGKDFPPLDVPSVTQGMRSQTAVRSGSSADRGNNPFFFWEKEGKEDDAEEEGSIVLPCVHPQCSMMIAASKGSAALRELHELKAIERRNRDTMDTSASDWSKLMGGSSTEKSSSAGPLDAEGVGVSSGVSTENPEPALVRRSSKPEQSTTVSQPMLTEEKWLAIQETRRSLPIYQCKDKLMQMIGEHAITVVVGETGSGKTTQLVQYLYESGYVQCIEEDSEGEASQGRNGEEMERNSDNAHRRRRRRRDASLIGCTQPRRLAAVGVARRVSEEMGCELGTTVGYSIHLDDQTTAETAIKFMTDGVLLREVMQDPDVMAYKVILLDEAHERSMDTDVLMGALKAAVARRRGDLKLIVTSATMDIAKFCNFFSAPCFHVPGKMFPVADVFATSAVKDYVAEAVYRVCQLHLQMPLTGVAARQDDSNEATYLPSSEAVPASQKQDILVFMSGKDDVMGTCELIHRRLNSTARRTLLVMPCLSEGGASLSLKVPAVSAPTAASSPGGEEGKEKERIVQQTTQMVGVLDPTPPGFRKCVVATNVAETSLTIDGIRYVIDAGFMKTNVYRPNMGMNTLQRYPVSQAQAGQRRGRAGRTAEGVCYHLYTQQQFEREMLIQSVPEIQRSSMDSVVLLLKSVLSGGNNSSLSGVARLPPSRSHPRSLQRGPVSSLRHFEFMDPPPSATIQHSMWTLWMMGFLSSDGDITELGRRALEFPMAPSLAKFVLEGAAYRCLNEVCLVVSMLSADPKNLFEVMKGKEEMAQQQHSRFMVPLSDHLTYLNVLQQFIEHGGGDASSLLAEAPQRAGGSAFSPRRSESAKNAAKAWAKAHFLHIPTLTRAVEMLEQLLEKVRRLRLHQLHRQDAQGHEQHSKSSSCDPPLTRAHRWAAVRRCLAHSFFLQSAQRGGMNWSEYRPLLHPGVVSQLHPGSAVCRQVFMPPFVVYNELLSLNIMTQKPKDSNENAASMSDGGKRSHPTTVATNKEYLMVITAVEPEWLVECSHGIFSLKDVSAPHRRTGAMTAPAPVVPKGSAVFSTAPVKSLSARQESKREVHNTASPSGLTSRSTTVSSTQSTAPSIAAPHVGMKRRRNI